MQMTTTSLFQIRPRALARTFQSMMKLIQCTSIYTADLAAESISFQTGSAAPALTLYSQGIRKNRRDNAHRTDPPTKSTGKAPKSRYWYKSQSHSSLYQKSDKEFPYCLGQ